MEPGVVVAAALIVGGLWVAFAANRRPGGGPPQSGPRRRFFSRNQLRSRRRHPRAYDEWTREEDERLRRRYRELRRTHDEGATIAQLSREFERSEGAIRSRLERLGLRN